MSIKQRFDAEKAIEVLLYVSQQCPDTYTALKVLYFADKKHLGKYGRLICGDTYVAMDHGPVPSNAYDFIKYVRGDGWCVAGDLVTKAFAIQGEYTIIPLREPDLDYLSESDRECLDEAVQQCKGKSFGQLKRLSHDAAYEASDHNSYIALEDIARSLPDGELVLGYLIDD